MINYAVTKYNKKIKSIIINIPADDFCLYDDKTSIKIKIEFYYNQSQLEKLIYIEFDSQFTYSLNKVYVTMKKGYKIYEQLLEYNAKMELENNLTNNIINMMYKCFYKNRNMTVFPYNHYIPIKLISQALNIYINSNVYKEIDAIMNKQEIIDYGL